MRNELLYDTAISTVYIETIRENLVDEFSPKFWRFVAHEIGHLTVDYDNNKSVGDHLELGLMTGEPETAQLSDTPAHRQFTATTLLRFREAKRW